ncbi:3-hexulose-6-phosphate isomerase [Lentibacillus kapialis]|uniref:3-hexulose-6-phosphate isomerase n=1 Tax=Lentibacillus kapialis TaxID=340214 RepID=A0A917UZH1_9BACI|nr:6-phospho-3-hexuloisomerase [Lentibacillus kapialis]GGK00675.1 3-hexulose-6-phosphate isomerase [Lentibacillus kapialis]
MAQKSSSQIIQELKYSLSTISEEEAKQLAENFLKAERIFVSGTGRSGLMLKAFAMRLMHLGFKVHVQGEITAPAITKGDLLLTGSGSGSTATPLAAAQSAKKQGAKVVLITVQKESPIGELSDDVLTINAPNKIWEESFQSVQPMGSLFEQSLLITLDAIILLLMTETNRDSEDMLKRHANLE